MSRKQIQVEIAAQAILSTLAALPSGAWFFLSNARLQGVAKDKPSDSRMNAEKQKVGFRHIGSDYDDTGNQVDIVCSVESPAQSWRENDEGNRVQGVNYPSVVFRGSVAKEAKMRALAWETVSVFGKLETTKDTETGKMVYRLTGMFITDGTEQVSVQLTSDTSKVFSIQASA
jgi:hypothetical protein